MTIGRRDVRRDRRGAPKHLITAASAMQPWLWLAPAGVLVGVIMVYPVIDVALKSTTSARLLEAGSFIGLENYERLLGDDLFWRAFLNGLILAIHVPLTVTVGIVVASILFRGLRVSRLYETLLFIPFLPATTAVCVIFIYLLSLEGPLNQLLSQTGLDSLAYPWLTRPATAIWSIVGIMAWRRMGLTIILVMAGFLSVDRELLEAAAIDGAGWGAAVRRVALPQMRGMVVFLLVLGFIEVFSFSFAYIFVLTNGGPVDSTYTLDFMMYRTLFTNQALGLASALGVVLVCLASLFGYLRIRAERAEGLLT